MVSYFISDSVFVVVYRTE